MLKHKKTSQDLDAVPAFTAWGVQACTSSRLLLLLLTKVAQEVCVSEEMCWTGSGWSYQSGCTSCRRHLQHHALTVLSHLI